MEENGDLENYRHLLEQRYSEVSGAYDKAIMTLSGGGLGVSIAFIKDISPNPAQCTTVYIVLGWIAFAASIAAILLALLFSQYAIRGTIKQIDEDTIHQQYPGGGLARISRIFNILSGVFFVLGVVLIIIFVAMNM